MLSFSHAVLMTSLALKDGNYLEGPQSHFTLEGIFTLSWLETGQTGGVLVMGLIRDSANSTMR